jgi:uncharacterized protein (DUF433 family)
MSKPMTLCVLLGGWYNSAMPVATYPHIEIRADGTAMIAGTATKVIQVVLDRLAHHWDADEIHRQHPHLSLAQIYAALAYYHDHELEMNRAIEQWVATEEEILASRPPSSVQAKLKALRARR